jgi:chromosome segregation ATPase
MRSEATIQARVIFLTCMAKRGFQGRISLRHSDETLNMGVLAASADKNNDAAPTQWKSASLLSGGERSYATVSLLLALWESAGGPLRCLDEWDVFLDQVNRDLAAGMLVSELSLS